MLTHFLLLLAMVLIAFGIKSETGSQKILARYYKAPAKEQKQWNIHGIRNFIFKLCLFNIFFLTLTILGYSLDVFILRTIGNLGIILSGILAIWMATTNKFKN